MADNTTHRLPSIPWLSYRAFIVSALAVGALAYREVAASGFSTEAVVFWIVTALVGGIFWGRSLPGE